MSAWLSNAVFYQIYPQSFRDSNADGIGDLPGILEKLEYIQKLGCNAIWINPCFDSPFQDAGYDIADYYTVAPRYGNNTDLRHIFQAVHRLGIARHSGPGPRPHLGPAPLVFGVHSRARQ